MTPATAANGLRPDEREADCRAVAAAIEDYWRARGYPGIRVRYYRRPTGAGGAPAGYDLRTNLGPDGYPPGGRVTVSRGPARKAPPGEVPPLKARSLIVLNAIQDIHAAGKRADYGSVVRATGQSKMTIQRALGDLTGAGLIETQGGRGTRGGMRFLPVESGATKETGQCT